MHRSIIHCFLEKHVVIAVPSSLTRSLIFKICSCQYAFDFEGTQNTVKQTSALAAPHFIGFPPHMGFDNNKK